MYDFKEKGNYITTIEGLEQFAEDISEETKRRQDFIDQELAEGRPLPEIMEELEELYVIIDELDDFIELAGTTNMPIVAGRMKRASMYGVVFIVTANVNKLKGIDEFTQLLKNPRNGLLTSSQGFLTMFPVKQSEVPQKPDGFLLREGSGHYVRIPLVR